MQSQYICQSQFFYLGLVCTSIMPYIRVLRKITLLTCSREKDKQLPLVIMMSATEINRFEYRKGKNPNLLPNSHKQSKTCSFFWYGSSCICICKWLNLACIRVLTKPFPCLVSFRVSPMFWPSSISLSFSFFQRELTSSSKSIT